MVEAPKRTVACSSVFFERDPLVFPSCFTEQSHPVKPDGEWSQRAQPKKWSRPRFPHDASPFFPRTSARWRLASGCKCGSRVRAASLLRPSRGEELGRALSVAVLCYGIPIGVLMLYALLAKGKTRARWERAVSHTSLSELRKSSETAVRHSPREPGRVHLQMSLTGSEALSGTKANAQRRMPMKNMKMDITSLHDCFFLCTWVF